MDALRALAAIVVAVSHWRALLFLDYALEPSHTLAAKAFYLFTQGGHTSVVVFFVLSGYLVAGSIFRSLHRGLFSFPLYLSHRLARLWAVLIPALLLGGLLDFTGLHHTQAHALYHGLVTNHVSGNVSANLNWTLAWRDALFLQRATDQNFGSNTPLWSLSYEFWYYVLFPTALLLILVRSTVRRVVCGLVLLLTAAISGMQILLLFPLWLAGAALHKAPCRAFTRRTRVAAALLFVTCFIGHSQGSRHFGSEFAATALDISMGAATAGFIWILLSSTSAASPTAAYTRLSHFIASFSYTLYAVHFPALLLLAAITVGNIRWTLTVTHLAIALGCFFLAVLWAYLLYWLFERRTAVLQSVLYLPVKRLAGAEPRLP